MAKLTADESATPKVVAKAGGARARLRAYFLANIGRMLDSAELRPVAGNISEWARRVRELGVYSEIVPGTTPAAEIATKKALSWSHAITV